jgi:hypothetical protein
MTTTFNTSCSENIIFFSVRREGFCLHVFSSLNSDQKRLELVWMLVLREEM